MDVGNAYIARIDDYWRKNLPIEVISVLLIPVLIIANAFLLG